jgi:protein pelota
MHYKILDKKKGIVRVYVDSKEDAIDLEKIIEPGDIVKAHSSRVIKQDSGNKAVIQANIAIRVEKSYLEGGYLKVIGKIVEASSEEIPLNKYHSFMLGPGSEFLLIKAQPSEAFYSLLRYIEEKSSSRPVLVVSLDEDSAAVAEISYNNLKVLSEIQGPGSPKRIELSEIYKYFENIIKAIQGHENQTIVFLVQPGIRKLFEEFLEEKYPELYKSSRIFEVTIGGVPGIREALKAGYLQAVSKQLRIVREIRELENLLVAALKDGTAAFGFEEVSRAVEYGAVKRLYVLESIASQPEIRKLIQDTLNQCGDVMFISGSHEAGRRLYYLGGVAALLRFPIE